MSTNPATPIDDEPPAVPDKVYFLHEFFNVIPGTYFKIDEHSGQPAMSVPLEFGGMLLRFESIKNNLRLTCQDPDSLMLDYIEESLKYVKWLEVGHALPTEISSGKASWSIAESFRNLARGRVVMQLVSWHEGNEVVMTDGLELAQVAGDPGYKDRVNQALVHVAEVLSLDMDRLDIMVEGLIEELAFVEALRDRATVVDTINTKIKTLWTIYRADRGTIEMLIPIRRMMEIAVGGLRMSLDEFDAQTGEIRSVLQNFDAQIEYIQSCRNDLHRRLAAWEEIGESWAALTPAKSPKAQALLYETYRFLAQRFLPAEEWELFSKAYDRTKQAASERQWM